MKRTKVCCPICGQLISKSAVTKHQRRHQDHPETFKEVYKVDHDDLFCKFCGKECKNLNSLTQHEIKCKENPNRKYEEIPGFNMSERTAWNKGLTAETDERVQKLKQTLRNKYSSGELRPSFKGKHHSNETKQLLSIKRIEFLNQNPDKVPYLLNHSSKQSYPEKYFLNLFQKENINLQYHYRCGNYQLDFCDPVKLIDIEIDGEQHYLDQKIIDSDIRRNEYLQNLGWKIFRIRWSDYQKSDKQNKNVIIQQIKSLIASVV